MGAALSSSTWLFGSLKHSPLNLCPFNTEYIITLEQEGHLNLRSYKKFYKNLFIGICASTL